MTFTFEIQNRWWAARILIMGVYFFLATRHSQGLFSRSNNSTHLIKHNQSWSPLSQLGNFTILLVWYSLVFSFNFSPFSLYIECRYCNKWDNRGQAIWLPREERLVTGGSRSGRGSGSGSRRRVKVGHFSWGQLEQVRSLFIYEYIHTSVHIFSFE